MDVIKTFGYSMISLDEYIHEYKSHKDRWEKLFLDNYNNIHAMDIWDNLIEDNHENQNRKSDFYEIEFEPLEKDELRFNPKAISMRIYGTPDYWEFIMRLNGIWHPGQLDLVRPLRLLKPEVLEDFIEKLPNIRKLMGNTMYDLKDTDLFSNK